MTAPTPASPFLKWVGGKRQLLPHMLPLVPKHFNTYIEPFVGGGALFFALQPEYAVLGDANARLITTYKAVRDDVAGVIHHLKGMPDERNFFMDIRKKPPTDPVKLAAWFIYLNKAGFNGLYRVNKKGEFNVPFGGSDKKKRELCQPDILQRASEQLVRCGTDIVTGNFGNTCLEARPGDFVYFDPPYVPIDTPKGSSPSFTGYTEGGFGDAEQVKLRDLARSLKQRGVHVLLSNASAPRVHELYEGFEIIEVPVTRMISSKASTRAKGSAVEVIIR